MEEQLKECIEWAINKPEKLIKNDNTNLYQKKKEAALKEREWGNKMIGQVNNGQWTTKLGEGIVFHILKKLGKNPRKPARKNGFEPDWETDDCIYEVKTSNWNIDGTAGEKVLGTFIKYQDIPKLYGKPLKIVCIAYQEYELTYGKTKYFGEDISEKTAQLLELARSWEIEYVKFSDFIKPFQEIKDIQL